MDNLNNAIEQRALEKMASRFNELMKHTLADPEGWAGPVKKLPEVMAGKISPEKANNAMNEFWDSIHRKANGGMGISSGRTKLEAFADRVKDMPKAAEINGLKGATFGRGLSDSSGVAHISTNASDGAWGNALTKTKQQLKGGISAGPAPTVSGDMIDKLSWDVKMAALEKLAGGLARAGAAGAHITEDLAAGFNTGVKEMGLNKIKTPNVPMNGGGVGSKQKLRKSLGGQGQHAGIMAAITPEQVAKAK